ncbi:MAG: hypothetical protein HW386_1382 [Gammaproteobacteria bacterium]|nr:hypothetical protein [Gammaproteobacteria bacterium]
MSRKTHSGELNLGKTHTINSSRRMPTAELTTNGSRPPLISPLDLCIVIALVVLTPIAWTVPQRMWSKLGRGVIAMTLRMLPRITASHVARIDLCLGPAAARLPAREILIRGLSHYFEDTLLLLKCYRPDGWQPVVRLQGLEHLQAAAAGGKGVVLWLSHFLYSSISTKIALRQAGFEVIHLSHPRHGYSSTLFGMRFLNPIRIHVEDRYLKERVSTGLNGTTTAVYKLRVRLAAGGIISITARDTARKVTRVPFLAGSLSLATGAPGLARQTKTTLLPVHTLQSDPSIFTTIIDPPIEMDDAQPRWDSNAAAALEYARRLEAVVLEFPDQWLGWNYLEPALLSTRRHQN